MNASVTFTMFIHDPDLGTCFSHEGKRAKSVNGKAKARAKPSIPMAGATHCPLVAVSTNSSPMIGAVHENDTSTSVSAMRKMERYAVSHWHFAVGCWLSSSALASTLLDHDAGRRISNHPKNDRAKITNSRNNPTLTTALVDSAFSVLAPKMAVTNSPSARYITTMLIPYVTASRMAFPRDWFRFRKKLTVIGIIGQMQGISTASNPPRKPKRKMVARLWLLAVLSLRVWRCEGSWLGKKSWRVSPL